jgi:methionine-rich copper-binding protein CopC
MQTIADGLRKRSCKPHPAVSKAARTLVKMIALPPRLRETAVILLLMFLCALPRLSYGHAYPDHADPKVGAEVSIAPVRVRIWFDSNLEPLFSMIIVQDASGKKVDSGDGRVSPIDDTLLEVGLPALAAGTYRVIWNVVARDGHRTSGDYTFTIR